MKYVYLILIVASALSSCTTSQPSKDEKPPEIPVIRIKSSKTIFKNQKVAEIQALKNVELRSRIRGFLDEILIDEGQEVRKGQPLFRLTSPEYSAELTKAYASLEKSKAEEQAACLEVERVQILVSRNVVAKTEVVLAESKARIAIAAVAESEAEVKNAKAFLSYATILAPFDGVINRIPLKIGSLINEGDLLTSISDITSIYAYFHMPEAEYLKYLQAKIKGESDTDKEHVHLDLVDGSEYNHVGVIETVASEFNGSTGAIAFRAKFPNPAKLLKHGSSGTIKLETELDKAILIPQKAVLEIQDKNYVLLVDPGNVLKMTPIEVGQRSGTYYLIKAGLSEGDRIVLEGVQVLREGNIINPMEKIY